MTPLVISSAAMVCAAGHGLGRITDALRAGVSGLRANDLDWIDLQTHIGRVDKLEESPVREDLNEFDSRNNRLAQMGLEADGFAQRIAFAIERYGVSRVAVVLGTSTSGIRETERAYTQRDPTSGALPGALQLRRTHEYFSLTNFVRRYLDLKGPAHVVSTACSSSSKAFADAQRLIEADLCDAAVVGGVDSLCLLTVRGFASLELLDAEPCRPNDAARAGLSIGESAGFALLERAEAVSGDDKPFARFLGYGESSDAHHMTAPDPHGWGAQLAMKQALQQAGLAPEQVDYVNLHGTGTILNDQAEMTAVHAVFGNAVPCSSTKGWTGHPLGAAGITGVLIAGLCIQQDFLPQNLNLSTVDPSIRTNILTSSRNHPTQIALANAFGFGGSNCSIILGACA